MNSSMGKSLAAETVLTSGRAGKNQPTLVSSTQTTEFLLLSSDLKELGMDKSCAVFAAVAFGGTFGGGG
jgi:hypothetical protein